jgi:hypothetical protein
VSGQSQGLGARADVVEHAADVGPGRADQPPRELTGHAARVRGKESRRQLQGPIHGLEGRNSRSLESAEARQTPPSG